MGKGRDRQTHGQMETELDRHTGTDGLTDRKIQRHTHRQTDCQTDRETYLWRGQFNGLRHVVSLKPKAIKGFLKNTGKKGTLEKRRR